MSEKKTFKVRKAGVYLGLFMVVFIVIGYTGFLNYNPNKILSLDNNDLFSVDDEPVEWHEVAKIQIPNPLGTPYDYNNVTGYTTAVTHWCCYAVIDVGTGVGTVDFNATLNATGNATDWSSTQYFRGWANTTAASNTTFAANDPYAYALRVCYGPTAQEVADSWNWSRYAASLTVTGDANANVAGVWIYGNHSNCTNGTFNTVGNSWKSYSNTNQLYINYLWYKGTTTGYYLSSDSSISFTYTIYEKY